MEAPKPNTTQGDAVQQLDPNIVPSFAGHTPSQEEAPLPPNDASRPLARMESVSLVDDASTGPQISLVEGNDPQPLNLSPQRLDKLTNKYAFALGKDYSKDEIQDILKTGQDASLRATEAHRRDQQESVLASHLARQGLSYGLPEAPEEQSVLYGTVKALHQYRANNNPHTIVEKAYAENYTDHIATVGPENNLTQKYISEQTEKFVEKQHEAFVRSAPEGAPGLSLHDNMKRATWQQEIVKKYLDNAEAAAEGQSWGDFAVEFGKSMLPFHDWVKTYNLVQPIEGLELQGSNWSEQIQNLYRLSPDEMEKTLNEKLTPLMQSNPQLAKQFTEAIVSYSGTDEFLHNAFGVIDIVGMKPLLGAAGVGALAAARIYRNKKLTGELATSLEKALSREEMEAAHTATAYAHAIKVNADPTLTEAQKLASLGDIPKAVEKNALDKAVNVVLENPHIALDETEVRSILSSVFNPLNHKNTVNEVGGPALAASKQAKLMAHLAVRANDIRQNIESISKVARLPEEALQAAFKNEIDRFDETLVHINDSVQNSVYARGGPTIQGPLGNVLKETVPIRPEENPANIGSVEFILSKPNGQGFASPDELTNWASGIYKLNLGDYSAKQQGNSWYIVVKRDIDETAPNVRDHLIPTNNKSPAHGWLGHWWKGAQEKVSEFQQGNRLAALHGQQALLYSIRELAKDIKLTGRSRDALVRVMEEDRGRMPPKTLLNENPKPGYFNQNVGEFETNFNRLNGRLPTDKETKAYFSAILANSIDYSLRNMNYRKELSRLGLRDTVISHVTTDQYGNKTFGETSRFHAKKLETLPLESRDPAVVAIYDEGKIATTSNLAEWNTDLGRRKLEDLLNQGYQIIQVGNPVRKEASGALGVDDYVDYIITKNVKQYELPAEVIPYRQGWHTEYDYDWYVKQPKVTQINRNGLLVDNFEGDVAWIGVTSRAEAVQRAEAINQARKIAYHGAPGNLREFLEKNLPYTESEFRKLFEGADPYFSKNHDFEVTFNGMTTTDDPLVLEKLKRDHSFFTDVIRSPHNLMNQVDKKFIGQRSEALHYIKEGKGGQGNPVFSLLPAERIDPYSSMSNGLANVMRNANMVDYRIQAVESWVKEFGKYSHLSEDELRSDVVNQLYNSNWYKREHLLNADPRVQAEIASGEASRRAIIEFLGHDSPVSMAMKSRKQAILDTVYTKFGQKASIIVDEKLLSLEADPLKTMRSIAFHSSMGFLNPFAWMQNIASASFMLGASPRYGSSGAVAGILWQMLRLNNKQGTIDAFAKIAKTFGYDEEAFKTGYREFMASGRHVIEGEHAFADDFNDPSIFQSGAKEFLDKGLFFFKSSERTIRNMSYATAYLEWVSENPGKKMTAEIRNRILARSDMFGFNMTRASAASWQQGLWSPATQFVSMPMRLMEMMLGKKDGYNKLSGAQRLQILASQAALYGVPVGLIGTAAGPLWSPWEDVRKHLLENKEKYGIDPNDKALMFLENGLVGTLAALATGRDSDLSTKLGFAGGGQVAKVIQSVLKQEPMPVFDMLLGSGYGKTKTWIQSAMPFFGDLISMSTGQMDYNASLLNSEMVGMLRTINSFDKATSAYIILMNKEAQLKNGESIGELNEVESFLYSLTGAMPMDAVDALIDRKMIKDRGKYIKEIEPEVRKTMDQWARAVDEKGSTDPDAKALATKLKVFQNTVTPDEWKQLTRGIYNDSRSIQEKMKEKMFKFEAQQGQISE